MALAKPTKLPRWGTDKTNEAESSEGQKDTGWTFEQIPPSSFQNFLQRVTYDWVAWIDERLDDENSGGGGSPENGLVLRDALTTEPNGPSRGVTKIRILNPVVGAVRIAAISITNNIGGGSTIEATGALFETNSVLLNDLIELVGTNSNDGFYLVSGITDEDNITARRLDGAGFTFAAEAGIQGTVKLYAKSAIRGELTAPGGWKVTERVGGEGVILKKNPGVGATIDWIFPDDLPSTKSFLSIDENGQVTAGVSSEVRTVGDGISSFGDFEGTDKTPFTDAMADLPAEGGTILVGRGTYTFATPFAPTANVWVIGVAGYQDTIIVGDGAAFQAHNVATIETVSDNVRLQGLTVTQTEGPFSNWCIFLKLGAEHCVVTECFADHQYAGADGSEIADQQAIVVEGSKNWVFRNRTNYHNKATETAKAGIRVGLRKVAGNCEGNQIFFNQAFVTENSGDSSEAAAAVMVMASDNDFGASITSDTGGAALTIIVQDNVIIGNHSSDGGNVESVISMVSGSANAGSDVTLTNNVISGNSGQFNIQVVGIDKNVHGTAGTIKNDENIVEGNSLSTGALTDNGNKLVWDANYVSSTTPSFTAKQLDMSDFNGNG